MEKKQSFTIAELTAAVRRSRIAMSERRASSDAAVLRSFQARALRSGQPARD